MATTPIVTSALRPYLAPVLLISEGNVRTADLLLKLLEASRDAIKATPGCHTHTDAPQKAAHSLSLHLLVYRQESHPTWLIGTALDDCCHELVILASRGRYAAVVASDGAMRDRIVTLLQDVAPLPREQMEAFIGDDASVLYLNGIHVPTAVKPDSKAITGNGVEYALDPLGDQSYLLSAARTQPKVAGLASSSKRTPSVGTSPSEGRIWVGRQKDWSTFISNLNAVMKHAQTAASPSSRFSMLAHPISDANVLKRAYAITIVPQELLSEDMHSPVEYEFARRWAYDATFKVIAGTGADFSVDCTISGVHIGTAQISVTIGSKGKAKINPQWLIPPTPKHPDAQECLRVLRDRRMVKIHYESGHAVAQGQCYASTPTDQPFDYEFQKYAGYSADQEKPSAKGGLAATIGATGDTSLFAFVLNELFVDTAGNPTGWLACDDGSMELADFIHLDPIAKVVSLIHVKASGSKAKNREVSVSDYEIVVGQTVKNVRHLHQTNLHEALDKGKGKKIGSAVWLDGVRQVDRINFLAAIQALPSHHKREAIIVQPRLTRNEHNACSGTGKVSANRRLRYKQLNTLLLGARQAVQSCGATLRVIADDI
jgi:hypothetical protein